MRYINEYGPNAESGMSLMSKQLSFGGGIDTFARSGKTLIMSAIL